jgi:uncharacterized membrane protein
MLVSFFSLTVLTVRIGVAGILAHNHAFVYFHAGSHEDLAALLQVPGGVAGGT